MDIKVNKHFFLFKIVKIVILDTDFLINAVRNHINIEESIKEICAFPVKIVVFDRVLSELEGKPYQKVVEGMLSRFEILGSGGDLSVDDSIIELVKKNKESIVCTQDKGLKERLKKGKIPIITIRQNKRLILV